MPGVYGCGFGVQLNLGSCVHRLAQPSFLIFSSTAEPEFEVEPEITNLPQGETAVFNCEAKGDPQPTITWIRNGEPLETHDTTVILCGLRAIF